MAFLKAMIWLGTAGAVWELVNGLYAIWDGWHDHDCYEILMGTGLILLALIQAGLVLACVWGVRTGAIV